MPWSCVRRTSSAPAIRRTALPYWPQRLARGGEVLAPGRRNDPVQFIDVRDLAEFMVLLLEDGKSGVYNVVGPQKTLTMPEFLEAARNGAPLRCEIHLG